MPQAISIQHGGQPLAMFKYACFRNGLDWKSLPIVDDGAGHVVASVGESIGPLAFSSLAATRRWLATDDAKRFTRRHRYEDVIAQPPG